MFEWQQVCWPARKVWIWIFLKISLTVNTVILHIIRVSVSGHRSFNGRPRNPKSVRSCWRETRERWRNSPEHAAPVGGRIVESGPADELWLLQTSLHAALPGAHHDGGVGRRGPVGAAVHREGRRLVAAARHPRGPQADLVEVRGEVVGCDLEVSLRCRSLPGQRTPGLRPAPVSIVARAEGPAVTETSVLATLGGAARQHGVRVGPQSDHVVRSSLQLKPGVSLVAQRAQARLLRFRRDRN